MEARHRIVTHYPLSTLWNAQGDITATRLRSLSAAALNRMLRRSAFAFVMADIGQPLVWQSQQACFAIWKKEIKTHLCGPRVQIMPTDYPDSYCYLASE